MTASPVGRWLFNEGSGTSTKDGYNGYTGTLTDLVTSAGGTAPTWITGHNGTAGTALNFDGKGGVVSVPLADTAVLNTTSSLSVWFKTTQVGSNIGWSSPSIIGTEHQGDANDIQWGTINSAGKIGLGLGNDVNGVYSASAVNDGNWHDLRITRTVNADGTSAVSLYVDGALSSSVGDAYLISLGYFALRIAKLQRVVELAQVGWRRQFRMHAPASVFLPLALPSPCRDET